MNSASNTAPSSSRPSSAIGRLAYLDWIRFFVVLSLTPFHAAITFTGMGSVYVYDTPVRDILLAGGTPVNIGPQALSYFTIFLDNWFMHLLFFVSGIGAALSLRKRSGGEFMGERSSRLMLPFLVCTMLLVPAQTWIGALSFGRFTGSLLAFYPSFFNGGYYNWGQFWFLMYLFVFSALALPLFLSIRQKGEGSRILSVARRFATAVSSAPLPLILLPALWTGLLEALFRPGWPGALNLFNDWAVFTLSLSFFLAGYIAGSAPELLQAIEKHRRVLLILGAAAFVARMSTYRVIPVPDGYSAANVFVQALRGIAAYGLVMAAIGYGQRYLNQPGRLQNSLLPIARDLSFPLYVLHYIFLTAVTYLLINSGLSIWARWGIAVAVTWGLVVLFTYLARYIPPVRGFFSIRQPAVKTP